ncbi:MAG: preprotein translocase subunit SecG [Vampirovibrionales bacterium]
MEPLTLLKWSLVTLEVISGVSLVLLILLHSPKSDGAGLGSVNQFFSSPKGAEATLTNITGVMAGIFVVCCFVLGYYF